MAKPATKATALWVVRRLRRAGFQALLAGGCVRDMLLGLRSSDYDVASDATPQQVRKLFRHVLLVGAQFGVAMVIHAGRKIEVTTFRSDVSYSDGRRPDAVRFSTPRQDALRRDFTINGMFADPLTGQVIDYVGGQEDLRKGILRTIGRPAERFGEDYLRMIRAVRFATRFGFAIEPATAEAVRKHAASITSISGERIFDELSKMLARPTAAQSLRLLEELGLARPLLPELFAGGLWERAVDRVGAVARRKDGVLNLGAMMAELPPQMIGRTLRRWGAANHLRDALCWMAEHLRDWPRAGDAGVTALCDFKRLLAHEHYRRLAALWTVEEKRQTGRIACARRIARRAAAIPPDRLAPPPLVTGSDLISMGLREGPALGRVLRALYDAQLDEEIASRAQALQRARSMIG